MSDISKFKLGDKVICRAIAVRRSMPEKSVMNGVYFDWLSKSKEPFKGVYAGYRYKQAGYNSYNGDYYEWTFKETRLVALILISPKKEPICVPFNAIDKIV